MKTIKFSLSLFSLLIFFSCAKEYQLETKLLEEAQEVLFASSSDIKGGENGTTGELPFPVLEYLINNYQKIEIVSFKSYETPNGNKFYYSVELGSGLEVVVFQNGTPLVEATLGMKNDTLSLKAGEMAWGALLAYSTHHIDETIENIKKKDEAVLAVTMKNGMELEISQSGKIVVITADEAGKDYSNADGTIKDEEKEEAEYSYADGSK